MKKPLLIRYKDLSIYIFEGLISSSSYAIDSNNAVGVNPIRHPLQT